MKLFWYGLLIVFRPTAGWRAVSEADAGVGALLLWHTAPFALLPAVSWYFGVTRVGWSILDETVRLTPASGFSLCLLFFVAMLGGVVFLGAMVRWMSPAYGGSDVLARGVALVSYTASPFFLAGLLGLYPVLWFDLALGTLAAIYCIYLLYVGTSAMLRVDPDRSFLYASSVLAVALVAFLGLMGGTILLWEFGAAPEYT